MRRALLVAAAVLVVGALGFSTAGVPGAAVAAGACLVVALLAARAALPAVGHRRPTSPPAPPPRFPRHRELSGLVEWAQTNPHYHHHVAVPFLRELAAALLRERRNVDLVHQPERARTLLGERAWAALADDSGTERCADAGDLRTLVDRLESL